MKHEKYYDLVKEYVNKLDNTRIYKTKDNGLIGLVNSDGQQTGRKILVELNGYLYDNKPLDGKNIIAKFYNSFITCNNDFIFQFYLKEEK